MCDDVSKLVYNALASKTSSELWRRVAGASAIVQARVDMLKTKIRKEKVDIGKTFIDLKLNFVTTLAGNYLGGKIIPTNPRWFKPQKFLSAFTKKYGQKILLQTAIGACLSGVINFIRKYDWSKFKSIIVEYDYSSYGKVEVKKDTVGISKKDHIRYKGYIYYEETKLYWVSSRYYSLELCRWISPDSIEYLDPESINGLNLYCYCMNDPINYADPSGCFPVLDVILCGIALVGM